MVDFLFEDGRVPSVSQADDDGDVFLSSEFIVHTSENYEELAQRLFYGAWDRYDEGADIDEINALVDPLIDLEYAQFQLSDYDDENDARAGGLFVLHGGDDPAFAHSGFASHIHARTLDAMMEIQDELRDQDIHLDRGLTNHSGTYKAQIAEEAAEALRKVQHGQSKNRFFLHYMQDVLGVKPQDSLDYDS